MLKKVSMTIKIIFVLILTCSLANAQYAERIHLNNFEYFFLKDYALRNVFGNDANILRVCKVKAAITTDSTGSIIYDSLKFDERGNLMRHTILKSDVRNDFEGFLGYMSFSEKAYKILVDDEKGKIEFTESNNGTMKGTGFPDIDTRIEITADSLKKTTYNFEGPIGDDYKVEFFEQRYIRINKFIETRTFMNGFSWKGNHPRYIYKYDSLLNAKGYSTLNNGGEEYYSVSVFYNKDTISFIPSDFDEEWLDNFPDLGKEFYIIKNNRIFRKEIIYPFGKYYNAFLEPKNRPIYLNTEYHYKENGLTDYTLTDYTEFQTDFDTNEKTYKEGRFKKYFRYEYY